MGYSNQPKILRGAFVEFGLSLPPLMVIFQFNPLMISRSRTASVDQPETAGKKKLEPAKRTRAYISGSDQLFKIRPANQTITVKQETFSFDIRLDATDKLNEGDLIATEFGIAPQLSTLELMMLPKNESLIGGKLAEKLGWLKEAFSFADDQSNPPVILFVWGRKKVLPVNITNMSIKEEEFSMDLNPIRATISVSLEVIEGPNAPYLFTRALKETMSALNLTNIGDIASTILPL